MRSASEVTVQQNLQNQILVPPAGWSAPEQNVARLPQERNNNSPSLGKVLWTSAIPPSFWQMLLPILVVHHSESPLLSLSQVVPVGSAAALLSQGAPSWGALEKSSPPMGPPLVFPPFCFHLGPPLVFPPFCFHHLPFVASSLAHLKF